MTAFHQPLPIDAVMVKLKNAAFRGFAGLSLVVVLGLAGESAGAQSSGRSFAAGVFGALAEQADKQIALENEIAAAQAKADIEFEQMKRLHALRQKEVPQTTSDREIAILDRSYPAWYEHANSKPFDKWIATQPAATQSMFKTVKTAEQMMTLLNEHRLSIGLEPLRLRK